MPLRSIDMSSVAALLSSHMRIPPSRRNSRSLVCSDCVGELYMWNSLYSRLEPWMNALSGQEPNSSHSPVLQCRTTCCLVKNRRLVERRASWKVHALVAQTDSRIAFSVSYRTLSMSSYSCVETVRCSFRGVLTPGRPSSGQLDAEAMMVTID